MITQCELQKPDGKRVVYWLFDDPYGPDYQRLKVGKCINLMEEGIDVELEITQLCLSLKDERSVPFNAKIGGLLEIYERPFTGMEEL